MKKLEVFCIFGISAHLAFLGFNFSFFLSFNLHVFIIYFSFFIISHHFLWLVHGFLMFCNIFDQKMRKMWRTLGKIWWFSRNCRKKINKWKNMIKTWRTIGSGTLQSFAEIFLYQKKNPQQRENTSKRHEDTPKGETQLKRSTLRNPSPTGRENRPYFTIV